MQAIAEFAFVSSEYPLILSIENHCRRHPRLMQHMANTFRLYFGDKLLSQPLDEYPVSLSMRVVCVCVWLWCVCDPWMSTQ